MPKGYKKVTAKDVPGTGAARKAGEEVEKRKNRNKSALEWARAATQEREGTGPKKDL